ncbi:MAG: Na+/H+ antiporter subunit D [SAR202 cluster bacterium]|nr:Na+/H+ antiporter subunit D [SAR202 cluster bacterium]
MKDFLAAAPLIVPLAGGVLLIATWGRVGLARAVSVMASLAASGLGFYSLYEVRQEGIFVTTLGDWPGPFGIVLVSDVLSTLMVGVTGLMAAVSFLFTMAAHERWQERYIYPFMLLLLAGVNGAFITGDLFNLFVFFEVTLLSSYALMAIGARRLQMEAAFKYVVINVISSVFLLVGVGLLYGQLGTLNMAHLAIRAETAGDSAMVTTVGVLLIVAFGIKAAIVPLHFWLPGAYSYIPWSVAAFFGAVLTKVGVYAMIRVFGLILDHDVDFFQPLLLSLAGVSMVVGGLGAVAQKEIRKVLTWDIVSQVGFMVMGLGLYSAGGMSAAIFFMAQYMPIKLALFLTAGWVEKMRGTEEMKKLGGLARLYPLASALFLLPALSLAGVPPLSGFWGKFFLLQAGFEAEQYAVAAAAVGTSLVTLYVMIKMWGQVYWGEPREQIEALPKSNLILLGPIVLAVLMGAALIFGASWLHDITNEGAASIVDPREYIEAVDLAVTD